MPEVPDDELTGDRGPDRRTVLRSGAVLGLAAAAGLPLAGCGGGSNQAVGNLPAAAPAPAPVEPARTSVPRSKSQLYRRGEGDVAETETLPTRSPGPAARPSAAPTAGDAAAVDVGTPSKADGLATARRPGQARPKTDGDPLPARSPRPSLPARTDDIPVGGGTVYPEQKMVVTQPKAGVYVAFDARCTHQGCLVADCSDGSINCPCHESKYSLVDGSVLQGPAKEPLPERRIVVTGGEIREK